jgi:hypothetical protein
MNGMTGDERDIVWLRDLTPARWLAAALQKWAGNVGSVVPGGFEAYARVFHPLQEGGHSSSGERWSDVARRNGRIVHSQMQLHQINRPPGAPPGEVDAGSSIGSLPLAPRRALVDILARETTTSGSCWFCMWEGWSLDDRGVSERVALPHRDYLFYGGDIEMAFALPPEAGVAFSYWRPAGTPPPTEAELAAARRALQPRLSPNLWWPDDRAWCVATEIDFGWTYVGGTYRAIARILASPDLEALPARLDDSPRHDGDRLNAALDAP